MLEVVFSSNAAGCLHMAMTQGRDRIGGAVSACLLGGKPDDMQCDAAAQCRVMQDAEAIAAACWKHAVPVSGTREDLFCFPLGLSMGSIVGDGLDDTRAAVLQQLHAISGKQPTRACQQIEQQLRTARSALERLRHRVAHGEPIRIWSSQQPDEACGLYWLVHTLLPLLRAQATTVIQAALPDFYERSDGTVIHFSGWGDVEPPLWGMLAARSAHILPDHQLLDMANTWTSLQAENAPLRAMLNGQLTGMPETLYDSFLERTLAAEPEEFLEAHWIGCTLGQFQLGIGDVWLALRIERWIAEGRLTPRSQADEEQPVYRRYLRKMKT